MSISMGMTSHEYACSKVLEAYPGCSVTVVGSREMAEVTITHPEGAITSTALSWLYVKYRKEFADAKALRLAAKTLKTLSADGATIMKHHKKLCGMFSMWRRGEENGFSKYIGCSRAKYRAHMKSQFLPWMNFDNIGEWHHDHIVPLSKAWRSGIPDYESQKAMLESLWHYSNIRPLAATENMAKGGWKLGSL